MIISLICIAVSYLKHLSQSRPSRNNSKIQQFSQINAVYFIGNQLKEKFQIYRVHFTFKRWNSQNGRQIFLI